MFTLSKSKQMVMNNLKIIHRFTFVGIYNVMNSSATPCPLYKYRYLYQLSRLLKNYHPLAFGGDLVKNQT